MFVGGGDVDIVNAHAGSAHGLELGGPGHDLGGDFGFGADHDPGIFVGGGEQFFRLDAEVDDDFKLGGGFEFIDPFF